MKTQVDPLEDALIIIDVQNDFCPGGALAVPEGDLVVPPLNEALKRPWALTVATRDWHPTNHCSFKEYSGIWPVHCAQGTYGAEFHPALDISRVQAIISKATEADKEAYSGFQGTELAGLLKARGIKRVFIGGLATDYCVKATALDARRAGFEVVLLEDACRGVGVNSGDSVMAIEELKVAGCALASTSQLTGGRPVW